MSGLIGKKIGMTSIFLDGKNFPCTVIKAGPCSVTQIKTIEKDGYYSIQLGFDLVKSKNTSKPIYPILHAARPMRACSTQGRAGIQCAMS